MAITAAQVPELLVAASGWIAEAWQDAAEDNADPDSPGGRLGYLEGMQMDTVTSRGLDPEAFAPWLRPTSARYWAALHRFWESGTPIPDLRS